MFFSLNNRETNLIERDDVAHSHEHRFSTQCAPFERKRCDEWATKSGKEMNTNIPDDNLAVVSTLCWHIKRMCLRITVKWYKRFGCDFLRPNKCSPCLHFQLNFHLDSLNLISVTHIFHEIPIQFGLRFKCSHLLSSNGRALHTEHKNENNQLDQQLTFGVN